MAALVDLPKAQPMALPLAVLEAEAWGLLIWSVADPYTEHRMAVAQRPNVDLGILKKPAVLCKVQLLLPCF